MEEGGPERFRPPPSGRIAGRANHDGTVRGGGWLHKGDWRDRPLSYSTIRRAVNELEAAERVKVHRDGGRANAYGLLPAVRCSWRPCSSWAWPTCADKDGWPKLIGTDEAPPPVRWLEPSGNVPDSQESLDEPEPLGVAGEPP